MPLIIDLSLSQDGITEAQRAEMQTRFTAWRKLDPNMNNVIWFVGTSIDSSGTVWTGHARPAKVVAGRISALAKAAMSVVEENGTEMSSADWTALFESPLGDYDFVIHLKSTVLKGYKPGKGKSRSNGLNGAGEFKNLQIAATLDTSSIGYDPVQLYLEDLNHAFGTAALFFHGKYGGKVIAGLWRPTVLGRKEWRVRIGWSSMPIPAKGDGEEGKDMCTFNKEAVFAEMIRMGEGIVKDIKVKE